MQTDQGPQHVDAPAVKVCTEEQVSRAVPPNTSVNAINIVCHVRDLGVDDEWLDIFGDDAGKGDSRSFDSRLIACHRQILERHRSWRGVNMYPKQTVSLALTCRAMAERGYTHGTPLLSRQTLVPVAVCREKVSAYCPGFVS